MGDRYDVLADVADERKRQDVKWGEQSHPDIDYDTWAGVPYAEAARGLCQAAAARREVTWGHILLEEVAEAFQAAHDRHGDACLRAELIQVAAVCVAWVEHIDRRTFGGES